MQGRGVITLFILILCFNTVLGADWWSTNYQYRKQLNITNNAGTTISTGTEVNFTINHASLVTSGKSLASGNDLRIVYWDGGSNTEVARVNEGDWNSNTEIWFKTQASISASATDSGYYVYYDYSSAIAPTPSDIIIDLSGYSIQGYGGTQDGDPSQYEVIEGGRTLRMYGNNWKGIAKSTTIASDTVLEFDFKSNGTQGEIDGMGWTNNIGTLDASALFQVYGTQTWGVQTYHDYSGTSYKTYIIDPAFTGTYSYIVFANDADASQATNLFYKNIKIRTLVSTDPSMSLGDEEAPIVCGDATCDATEDYSTCPSDCCESDCTATNDSTLHYACDTYNSCSILSGCDGQDSGYLYCIDSNTYGSCPATQTDCSDGLYCASGTCGSCSSVCDNTCNGGVTCYITDPDCDVNGTATTACCGNTICEGEANESCNTCSDDCGLCVGVDVCNIASCRGSCGTCKENQCVNNVCVCDYISNCCGNNVCETDESYTTCDTDCGPSSITVDLLEPTSGSTYMRGEEIVIVANVTYEEGVRGVGANVTATTPAGDYTLRYYNTDGTYKANITIPNNASTGTWSIDITAKKGVTGAGSRIVTVSNEYIVTGNTDKATYTKNERILLSGSVTNARGEYVDSDLTININEDTITTQTTNGFYNTSHLTNILDPTGTWDLTITASDEHNNSGTKTINVEVNEPEEGTYYTIDITSPLRGAVKRGWSITITIEVMLGSTPITNALVKAKLPDNSYLELNERGEGIYSSGYTIPFDAPIGEWSFEIIASKNEFVGVASQRMDVDPSDLIVSVISPTRSSYSVGEDMNIVVEATYPNGESVAVPEINITLGGKNITLENQGGGVYSTSYSVSESDEDLSVNIVLTDESNNTGTQEFSISVSGTSLLYYFKAYPYIVWPVIAVGIAGLIMGSLKFIKKENIAGLKNKKKKLTELKKKTQQSYFVEQTISKGRYDELIAKYNSQIDTVKNKMKSMKKEGKKK